MSTARRPAPRSAAKASASATRAKKGGLGKTTRPSVTGVLPRERLFSVLDRARVSSVVWVSGPPGCGKTTLVASYVEHLGATNLWYQLDEGDADVATFFYYLAFAAREHDDFKGEALPLLAPEYHASLPAFTRRYFQTLFSRLTTPFVVVFDGYDEVPTSSKLHEIMREALHQLPREGCVIFISRGDPPPTTARLRASRALSVIDWEVLRLTAQEIAAIVRLRGRKFSEKTIGELYGRTQGWAAGLALLLEQSQVDDSVSQPHDLSTPQLVFDYLADQVFQRTDLRTQEFLLKTAFLAQMTVGVARELTGDSEAGAILSRLQRKNYFVTLRQVQPESVFQYHPMLREFLLSRVAESVPKDQRRSLQQASGRLMEAAGQVEDAVALFRESGDWEEIACAIDRHAATLLNHGRGETLVRWVEELPESILRRHPWAVCWAATSRLQAAPRESRLLYERAFELFRGSAEPDSEGMILACTGVMEAIVYELDDFSLLDQWIAVLDELTNHRMRFPSANVEGRVACSMFSALILRQPQGKDVDYWANRAFNATQAPLEPNLRMEVGLVVAVAFIYSGNASRAMGIIELMRGISHLPEVSPFSLIKLKNIEAMYYTFAAMHEPCLQAVREGLEIAKTVGVHTWTFQLMIYGAAGALGAQDLQSAAKLLKELEAHIGGTGRFNLCLYHYVSAWEAILRKDATRALAQQRVALRLAVEVGCPHFEALFRLALAQIYGECGDEAKALSQLRQMHAIVRHIRNRHLEFNCLLIYAQLALEHGRRRPGIRALRYGLSLGRQHNYTHFLWWRPAPMARLCVDALEAGIEVDYVKSLVKARNLNAEIPPLGVEHWPWALRVSTLGVFRLLHQDAPLPLTGKAQRRPLDMLRVLIAYGGESVSEELVTDALWPRTPGDSAHRSFTSTLHRLRKLIGEAKALVLHEGKITLDRRYFWVDAWAVERLGSEIDAALKQPRQGLEAAKVAELADRMLGLYGGPFLATDTNEPWCIHRRERLRQRFVRSMTEIGRYWEESRHLEQALQCYERCLEVDPLAEGFYRRMMICHQHFGRRAEAIEVFNRCRKALAALNVEPSAEARAIYEQLLRAP